METKNYQDVDFSIFKNTLPRLRYYQKGIIRLSHFVVSEVDAKQSLKWLVVWFLWYDTAWDHSQWPQYDMITFEVDFRVVEWMYVIHKLESLSGSMESVLYFKEDYKGNREENFQMYNILHSDFIKQVDEECRKALEQWVLAQLHPSKRDVFQGWWLLRMKDFKLST